MRGGMLAAVVGAPAALIVGGSSALLAVTLIAKSHRDTLRYKHVPESR